MPLVLSYQLRIGVGPGFRHTLGASAGKLDGDHGLDAADKEEVGLSRGSDLEPDEKADFFHADQFGDNFEMLAKPGRFEVVDFGPRDDGDEPGAAHFLERPAERGGELRAGDFNH